MEPVADIKLEDSCKISFYCLKINFHVCFIDKNSLIELSVYIKENVLSESALKCTENVIEHNEGHYTAW